MRTFRRLEVLLTVALNQISWARWPSPASRMTCWATSKYVTSIALAVNVSDSEPKKVRDRQLAAPLESTTLQKLVKSELATKKHAGTEGLLWLVRGLDFCAQALRADINAGGSQELSTSFRGAYKTSLAPYHSFLVTPYRKDFAAKVAGDSSNTSKAEEDMKVWVAALEERVAILLDFLGTKEAKW
jgi:Glycolipid transfer protein (GLTP)